MPSWQFWAFARLSWLEVGEQISEEEDEGGGEAVRLPGVLHLSAVLQPPLSVWGWARGVLDSLRAAWVDWVLALFLKIFPIRMLLARHAPLRGRPAAPSGDASDLAYACPYTHDAAGQTHPWAPTTTPTPAGCPSGPSCCRQHFWCAV